MKKIFLILISILTAYIISPNASLVHAQASNCCPSWVSTMGTACTTAEGFSGTCQTSGNVEPYLSQCSGANPPVLSCILNCAGVFCPGGSTAGTACTTPNGDSGTCQNALHVEPYLTMCPHSVGQLACQPTLPPPGCCLTSQQGDICLINATTTGTCRPPENAFETTQCLGGNICGAPTSSGSYTCNCTNTATGYSCTIGADTCQMGLMPNITECNPNRSVNPCGGNASFTSCQLPCVPGGYLEWGEYGCTPYDPNAIPPIPQDQICEPGIVCQNAGWCMKPDGSVPFSEPCIWDSECATCQTGNNCSTQMTCEDYDGDGIGMCDGQCGGVGPSDCVDIWCNNQPGTVRTALGCVQASDPQALTVQIIGWATRIVTGILVLNLAYAGFLYTTAAGDTKRAESGIQLLSSSFQGLAIVVLAVLILNFFGVRILNLNLFGFIL